MSVALKYMVAFFFSHRILSVAVLFLGLCCLFALAAWKNRSLLYSKSSILDSSRIREPNVEGKLKNMGEHFKLFFVVSQNFYDSVGLLAYICLRD